MGEGEMGEGEMGGRVTGRATHTWSASPGVASPRVGEEWPRVTASVPREVYDRIIGAARRNFRSVSGEVAFALIGLYAAPGDPGDKDGPSVP